MKILYFGTVCNLDAYHRLLENSKVKPSVASIVFETSLLQGLFENGVQMEIHSFPMIPAFPHSKRLFFGGQREQLPCGYTCRWLRTINIPVLKQLSRRFDARRIMKRWAKENAGEGIIFTYSIPPFLVADVLKYAKRFGVKAITIVPDLLCDMYINEKPNYILTKLKKRYVCRAQRLQDQYHGYIYLTKAMCQAVAPEKPYIVVEAIADVSSIQQPKLEEKANIRAIMYAGMLHEKYGIINLLDAFDLLSNQNTELWLFGQGTAVAEIQRRTKNDARIKYFGSLPREIILQYERQATCLINPRNVDEMFTEYSFPSKTIEYMLSGTPVLTTKLKGIPSEYFEYVFTADSNAPVDLKLAIEAILKIPQKELVRFGQEAQGFVAREKNSYRQAQKLMTFFKGVVYDS